MRLLTLTMLLCLSFTCYADHHEGSMDGVLEVQMGDYKYMPDQIEAVVGQPVKLKLVNLDSFTPHDFVLISPDAGVNVEVDIGPGGTEMVEFTPQKAGSFRFHCSKKLLFFESHEEKGMHGMLIVKEQ